MCDQLRVVRALFKAEIERVVVSNITVRLKSGRCKSPIRAAGPASLLSRTLQRRNCINVIWRKA